jgi:lipopolysaccharide transport system ATP-binding protein
MSDTAVVIENLGKRYRLGEREPYGALRDVIATAAVAPFRCLARRVSGSGDGASKPGHIWALRDVSLRVKEGEVLGIIGRNGAGKTTLLKILSRVTEPSEGMALIRGRVGSLLEVGAGFHPELTGRENIYFNGAILGMSRREIARKFDEIVAFAEMEEFIDTPVKRYSSGMYTRLGFAVAAHLEPEILVVDEVLAVGDAAFQQKCLGKMGDVAREGRTVLFVSHNMAAVQALCGRGIVLDGGRVVAAGSPPQVIETYLATTRAPRATSLREREDRSGNGLMRFTELVVEDGQGKPLGAVASGQDIQISLAYEASDSKALAKVSVSVAFHDMLGQLLLLCKNELTGDVFETLPPRGNVVCRIPRLPFYPGRYPFNLHAEANGVLADWLQPGGELVVVEGDFYGTGRLPPATHRSFLAAHSWAVCERG